MLTKAFAERGSVTSGSVSLDAADLGLIESLYKKNFREAEERLMLAVLESAVEYFQKYALARKPREKQLFQEAEDWFLEKDDGGLFSFESICVTLGLHPGHIRKGLMVWKEARLKVSSGQSQAALRPKLARNRAKRPSIRFSKTA